MIQQTIQEVKFEDIILSKKQRQAKKTNKLRHWLEYLNMLDENNDSKRKNDAIREIHSMFILREDFWLRQLSRVFKNQSDLNVNSFQFAFMALEDGFYLQVAKLIAQKLFEAYKQQKLRINFVVAKLQHLISQFDFFIREPSFYYQKLIEVYLKSNNTKKVRQTFQRQISRGFEDYDVVYAEYIKWQQTQQQVNLGNNSSELLKKGRQQWQAVQIFLQDELPKIQNLDDVSLSQQIVNNQKYIKQCIYYLENQNVARVNQQKYLSLVNLLSVTKDKLWYLRRMALSEAHQLVEKYFQALELYGEQDQQIIKVYKIAINWQNGRKYQLLYLMYLIRRINKHLSKAQSQEYNGQWGQNVQFFRNEITQLISKERANISEQKQILIQYYKLWIQVETIIVKDVSIVQQLFQSLINWERTEDMYVKYAEFMIRLNDIPKARWIYNKTCETYGYHGSAANKFKDFLSFYGSLEQIIKINEKMKESIKQSAKNIISQIFSQQKKQRKSCEGKQKTCQDQQKTVVSQNLNQNSDNAQITQKKNLQKQIPNEQKSLKRTSPVEDERRDKSQKQKKKVHLDLQNTLFSNTINKSWTEADIILNLVLKQHVNEIRIIEKQNGRFCYIEFDSQENAQKELTQNKSILNLTFSHPPSKSDERTLFLCNLPTSISKIDIQNLIPLKYHSEIKEIRCKDKKDKKTVYIQFNSQEVRDEALSQLQKQKPKVQDRAIIAMSCQSDNKSKEKKNRTIFLKNLSFKCKEKDIRSFFEQKGFTQISEVFVPKDQKTNRPKGFAYVEFQNHYEAEKAILLQKGSILNRQFSINRSDRGITHYYSNHSNFQNKKAEKEQKPKPQNKKTNNFFSNIFQK